MATFSDNWTFFEKYVASENTTQFHSIDPKFGQFGLFESQFYFFSTVAAILTVMLGNLSSNPGGNHGCMYLSRCNDRVSISVITDWAKSLWMWVSILKRKPFLSVGCAFGIPNGPFLNINKPLKWCFWSQILFKSKLLSLINFL